MKDWHVIFGLLWLPCLVLVVWCLAGAVRRRIWSIRKKS